MLQDTLFPLLNVHTVKYHLLPYTLRAVKTVMQSGLVQRSHSLVSGVTDGSGCVCLYCVIVGVYIELHCIVLWASRWTEQLRAFS